MSVSYLVLTPPGMTGSDENARFVADRFSWVAFLFPAIWLLFQRQWTFGLAVFGLQIALGFLSSVPHLVWAGLLLELALRLLVGLEGSAFVAGRLASAGWTLRAVVPAEDSATAEHMYYHAAEAERDSATPVPYLPLPDGSAATTPSTDRPGFGPFASYGER